MLTLSKQPTMENNGITILPKGESAAESAVTISSKKLAEILSYFPDLLHIMEYELLNGA